MPYEVLQYVVGRALTDPAFHAALLQDPVRALAGVAMTDEERAVLTAGRATSLRMLAKRVDRWLERPGRLGVKAPSMPVTGSPYDGFEEFADLAEGAAQREVAVVELLKSA